VLVGFWLRYSWRVIAIGRQFEDMPEPDIEDKWHGW
jgi:hypothetical protein